MKCLAMVGAALIFASGCSQSGSGTTGPSTNPNRPNEVRSLKVKSPSEASIKQNGTVDVEISVARGNFNGPVHLDFRDLPQGVKVVTPNTTIDSGKDSLVVALKAAPDAAVEKGHVVHVAAKANDQKDLPEDVASFKFEVKVKD
jgi:ABC-type glycerol-3-phosphate transport system substrate-binding protein